MDVNSLLQYFTVSPSYWTQKEVALWLELLNMKEYQHDFEINKVDGLIIFDLEDKEIEEILGVKNSIHRKRLRNGINILKQFKDELEKMKKKPEREEVPVHRGLDFTENFPSLSTSVINAQQAKVLSIKSNHFSHFNNQTAQRRELENIFSANALANFDGEINYSSQNLSLLDQGIEEEKAPLSLAPNELKAFDNKKSIVKSKTVNLDKSFEQPRGNSNNGNFILPNRDASSMNIEDEEAKRDGDNKNCMRHIKKSLSDTDKYLNGSGEKETGPSLIHYNSLDPLNRGVESNNNAQGGQNKNMVQEIQPVLGQTVPAELIIQPIDGVQSNNFYCINETGGRIGRHSDNEIVILEESVSRYHSIIEYRDDRFYLIDRGSTTGSFIKIVTPLVLEEKMIVEMGSNQFLVEKIVCKDAENGELYLKIIEGMHAEREFVIQNNATFGRKGQFSSTTIALVDDLHLSNTHTKVSYLDSKFILEDLASTNGTWLRMSPENVRSKPFELTDNVIFKIGASSTFKVKRSNKSYLEMMQSPKNYDGSMNCAVCYENERDVVLIPCKHNVTCLKCSKNLKQCPVCRYKINDIIRIYKA